MAREVATDFLHSMRFQVVANDAGRPTLDAPGRVDAGFTTVSTPEATVEAVEYREGTFIYMRKFPGNPTVADLTFNRGVAKRDSSFWDWLRVIIEGSGDYRQDLQIKHFHRQEALPRSVGPFTGETANQTVIDIGAPARVYHVREAFPVRHKVAGDLDATASEVSIMELDVAFEHFEVQEVG